MAARNTAPPNTELARPARLADEVYNALYARLMSHEIPPGHRIGIDGLSRALGVSQTPVREALSRLEVQGLVVKEHLIGYSAATQMEDDQLRQLYELRLLLEPFAAAQAAIRMTATDKRRLAAVNDEMHRITAVSERRGYADFARKDGQFHDMICAGSGNHLLQEAIGRLHTHVHLFRRSFHAQTTSVTNTEHDAILAAIRDGDAAGAEAAMRVHIETSSKRFMES
ncbi:GntR family transcriptional regulator [Falsirhodobacter xinxiangensis]|uniref:GntR family transcriptional regulator n=1 Tax=Falsirhodobacter xinxiangensis TaxID=2530049 RepID=UPI0010AB42D7|nr:GntR family transcriptional regulator [Rhodobacter xinxiangensis]